MLPLCILFLQSFDINHFQIETIELLWLYDCRQCWTLISLWAHNRVFWVSWKSYAIWLLNTYLYQCTRHVIFCVHVYFDPFFHVHLYQAYPLYKVHEALFPWTCLHWPVTSRYQCTRIYCLYQVHVHYFQCTCVHGITVKSVWKV